MVKPPNICATYAATIRHIDTVDLPSITAKIALLEALLTSLQEQGVADSDLETVQASIDQANQDLADTNGQLEAFTQEYEIHCSPAGNTRADTVG